MEDALVVTLLESGVLKAKAIAREVAAANGVNPMLAS